MFPSFEQIYNANEIISMKKTKQPKIRNHFEVDSFYDHNEESLDFKTI